MSAIKKSKRIPLDLPDKISPMINANPIKITQRGGQVMRREEEQPSCVVGEGGEKEYQVVVDEK